MMLQSDREPAAERAYLALERMIVTLDLLPESTTTEGELIDRLGIGRTPVREAIQRLAWEGLLIVRPRAGIAVAPLSPGDWLKIIEARRAAETILARSAARFVTGELAGRLNTASLAMQKSVITGNVLSFLEADKMLDTAIALAADNQFAARLAAPLQTHSRRFWYRYQNDAGLGEAANQHVNVMRAILDGDEQGAVLAVQAMMDLLHANAMEALRV